MKMIIAFLCAVLQIMRYRMPIKLHKKTIKVHKLLGACVTYGFLDLTIWVTFEFLRDKVMDKKNNKFVRNISNSLEQF